MVYTSAPAFYWYVLNYSSDLTYTVRVQGVSQSVSGYSTTHSAANTSLQWPEDLVAGQQYQWSVCTNRTGYSSSAFSTPELFTVYANVQSASRPIASWPVNSAIVYVNPPALYWYTNGAAIGVTYNVQLQPASVPLAGSPVIASGLANLSYQLTSGLTAGTSYHWRVQSVLNGVTSDWSAEAAFTMNGTIAAGLPQPSLIYPINTIVYTGSPMLTWIAAYSSAITQYRVTIATNPALSSQVAGSPFTTNTTNYSISGLVPGATYYWGVQSSDGSSYSLMSATGSFTVNAGSSPVVPKIGGPDGIYLPASSAVLNWYLPVISTSSLTYDVEYSTSADFTNAVTKSGVNTTSYGLSDLQEGVEYFWRVKSTADGRTSSGYSLSGSFKTSGVTDVEDIVLPSNFEVMQNYPNPFNPVTNIKVKLPENTIIAVKIYNIVGQEIKTLVNQEMNAGTYTFQWNGENNSGSKVPSGTYICRVMAGNNPQTLKMILLK